MYGLVLRVIHEKPKVCIVLFVYLWRGLHTRFKVEGEIGKRRDDDEIVQEEEKDRGFTKDKSPRNYRRAPRSPDLRDSRFSRRRMRRLSVDILPSLAGNGVILVSDPTWNGIQ